MVKKTKLEFLALPQSEAECVAVDMEHGLWIQCGICDSTRNPLTNRPYNMIMVKDNSPFTCGRWTEHKKTAAHSSKLRSQRKSMLEEKERSGTITRLELGELNQQFRKKQKTLPFMPAAAAAATTTVAVAATTTDTTTSTTTAVVQSNVAPKPPGISRSCEGVIAGYRKDDVQRNIEAYIEFCAIKASSGYVGGRVEWNMKFSMFAANCNPNEASYDKVLKVYRCDNCKVLQ